MGKKLLHPKSVDKQEFLELGFPANHEDLKKIKNLPDTEYNRWLTNISNKLITECTLRQVKLNRAGKHSPAQGNHEEAPNSPIDVRQLRPGFEVRGAKTALLNA